MWEIHEVGRKMFLMGILIFFPPMARSAAAILMCVMCCCTLNYFRPHRNRVVLMVAQISFLMTTFKYIVAVLLQASPVTNVDEQKMLGWLLLLLDICFMVGSSICMLLIGMLLRTSIIKAQRADVKKTKRLSTASLGATLADVAPADEKGSKGDKGGANNTKVHPVKVLSEEEKQNATLAEVKNIQKKSELARRSTLRKVRVREVKADARVQKRLALRKKAKQSGALAQCSAFSTIQDDCRNHIVDAMTYEKVQNGAVLCMQGDPAECMYLIMKGSCTVMINMQQVATLNCLDLFGEAALFGTGDENDPSRFRSATIIAMGDLELLVLNQKDFKVLIASGDLNESTLAALREVSKQRKEANLARCKSQEEMLSNKLQK